MNKYVYERISAIRNKGKSRVMNEFSSKREKIRLDSVNILKYAFSLPVSGIKMKLYPCTREEFIKKVNNSYNIGDFMRSCVVGYEEVENKVLEHNKKYDEDLHAQLELIEREYEKICDCIAFGGTKTEIGKMIQDFQATVEAI